MLVCAFFLAEEQTGISQVGLWHLPCPPAANDTYVCISCSKSRQRAQAESPLSSWLGDRKSFDTPPHRSVRKYTCMMLMSQHAKLERKLLGFNISVWRNTLCTFTAHSPHTAARLLAFQFWPLALLVELQQNRSWWDSITNQLLFSCDERRKQPLLKAREEEIHEVTAKEITMLQ